MNNACANLEKIKEKLFKANTEIMEAVMIIFDDMKCSPNADCTNKPQTEEEWRREMLDEIEDQELEDGDR